MESIHTVDREARPRPQRRAAARLPHIPALDGLRGLAVVGVLFYHAGLRWMPGGFLGVDIFFVLSGYLITASLLYQWDRQGQIDLPRFWQRRIVRLFPAMAVSIAVILVGAALWLPDQGNALYGDALAAAGYVSNWHLILTDRPYFEAMGRPPLLRHMWSLAVEAQFYLLWAPLFVATIYTSRRRVWIAALLGGALSLAWMAVLYQPGTDPSRVYYGTDTRLAAPLAGAVLAGLWGLDRRRDLAPRAPSWAVDAAGLGAVGTLVAGWVWVHEYRPFLYRGGFGLVALFSAVAIAAAVHPNARLLDHVLRSALLRWLGTRSYSIYLWHWPVFMVTRPRLDVALDGAPLLLVRLAVTALLAEGSYRLVERPFRYSQAGWVRLLRLGVQRAALLAAAVAVCITLVPAAMVDHPFAVAPAALLPATTAPPDTPTLPTAAAHETARPQRRGTRAVFVFSDTPIRPTPTMPATPTHTATPTRPAQNTPLPTAEATEPAPTQKPRATPTDVRPPPTDTPAATNTAPPPTPSPTPDTTSAPPHVLALGDSVMVGARRTMQDQIPNIEVDASIGRQAPEMIRLLHERRQAGTLGDIVVIHLGSNGIFGGDQFDQMMALLADVPKVIFVNVQVPRRWQDPINDMLVERAKRYDNVVVADWYAASIDCTDCFIDDGVHLRPNGAALYTAFIAASLELPLQDGVYDPLR